MASKVSKHQVRLVLAGHVDHGKSTLIGRLLYDTGSVPDSRIEEVIKSCERRGVPTEWSYLLDSFQAERDQAITIETTQIWLSTEKRDYVLIDAPGHKEFLKNMITGASAADAGLLIIDVSEGLQEQTRRHAYILSLLGLRQLIVVINKMDAAGYDPHVFEEKAGEIRSYLKSLDLQPLFIIPASARAGDMVEDRGENMDWYDGKTLTEALDSLNPMRAPVARAMRFPVQDVYRHDEKRIIVGRLESGTLNKGDTLLFSPSNETAVVTSFATWPDNPDKVKAVAGESIGVTLDKPIFVERGHVGSHDKNPPMLSNVFKVSMFWFSEKTAKAGDKFKARMGPFEANVTLQSIEKIIDTDTLGESDSDGVARHQIAVVTLRAREMLAIDSYTQNYRTGRCVLYNAHIPVGAGIISMEGYPDQRTLFAGGPASQNITTVDHLLDDAVRAQRNGHYGSVFWFTGLSGSGKSTLAMKVEKRLFDKGFHTYVLDGDNMRHGLNSDLGFKPQDRAENIRRAGEVAALQADAGLICIASFISPYREDRERAKKASKENYFYEIYIKASLAACEKRDPKGLYQKARKGDIKNFTGIDAPYEEPHEPDLLVDTVENDVEQCVQMIVDFISEKTSVDAENSLVQTA